MIIASADNHPPMLEKSLYDSWKSRMELYIVNRENRRMILNSVQNGLLIWPTVVEGMALLGQRGLSPDVYAIVNHHKVAKEIWDRVKLLMQGIKLSLQEKECIHYLTTVGMVDKGKAIMQESEPEQTTIKLEQRQERAGYEAVVRLQEQLDEEERQRIARVHEEASSFNVMNGKIFKLQLKLMKK
uniref:Integrase, catalytic region, zinc finger, CCHC-type, peptidase aspartic, catalytic n=1 Tax=Tanacetum cinerariifolium TaxID=118510 RepID=A0A6L2JWA6_TANCI|nr:hypothetical protein [Tanacetum cinerariifolium]